MFRVPAAGGSLAIAEGQTRAEFIVSHPGENDNLNNRFTVTLEAGAGFPDEWLVDSDRNTSLVVFNDATPLPNTIGWETSAIEIAEGGAAVTASLKPHRRCERRHCARAHSLHHHGSHA